MNSLRALWIVLVLIVVSLSGCAICQSPFDDHYAAYGGIVERTDRTSGRVNSAFSGSVEAAPEVDAPVPDTVPPPAAETRTTSLFGF